MAIPTTRRPDTVDARTGARVCTPTPTGAAAASAVVNPAKSPGPVRPRLSGPLFQKDNSMLPQQNHPLTRAYLLGARSNTAPAYAEALRLIRACEADADQLTIDQCKLAADVMIERRME
jgi:hypothetical protein